MGALGNALSKPLVLALALVLFTGFLIFGYPVMGSLMREHTPAGAEFDTVFAYSPAEAVRKAAMYDDAGRAAMIAMHWTYDLAFPAVYGFLLAALWAFGLRHLAGPERDATRRPRYGFLAVPIAGSLFDLLENASVSVLLAASGSGNVPGASGLSAVLASCLASGTTVLKGVFVSAAFAGGIVLPAAGILVLLKRNVASRAPKP